MDEVRRLRLEKGWSQNELAYHAKLAPSVISLIETGKRDPNATTLRKLAGALEVRIPDLFGESGSGKAQRRSALEPSLFNGLEEERRTRGLELAEKLGRALHELWRLEVDRDEFSLEAYERTGQAFVALDTLIADAMTEEFTRDEEAGSEAYRTAWHSAWQVAYDLQRELQRARERLLLRLDEEEARNVPPVPDLIAA